jgi:hypothetical protein
MLMALLAEHASGMALGSGVKSWSIRFMALLSLEMKRPRRIIPAGSFRFVLLG